MIRRPKSARSRKSRSNSWRLSPTKRSSPSRTSGCSTNCRHATVISPRRWSSRRRPANLRVISSSPTDLSRSFKRSSPMRVRLCGNDIGALYRFDGEHLRLAASHNVNPRLSRAPDRPIRPGKKPVRRAALERRPFKSRCFGRDRICGVSNERIARGRRSTLAVPLLRKKTSPRRDRHSVARRSETVYRQSNKTARDLRRPGRDRHRKRPAVPRAKGVVGAANGDE